MVNVGKYAMTMGSGHGISNGLRPPPHGGGQPCPADLEREVACNEKFCPVDCQMSPWKDAGVGPLGGKWREKNVTM